MTPPTPSCLYLLPTSELLRRVKAAYARLAVCDICPWRGGAVIPGVGEVTCFSSSPSLQDGSK